MGFFFNAGYGVIIVLLMCGRVENDPRHGVAMASFRDQVSDANITVSVCVCV